MPTSPETKVTVRALTYPDSIIMSRQQSYLDALDSYCRQRSQGARGFALDDYRDQMMVGKLNNELYIDLGRRGYVANLSGLVQVFADAPAVHRLSDMIDYATYGDKKKIGLWIPDRFDGLNGELTLFYPLDENSPGNLDPAPFDDWLQWILDYLPAAKLERSIDPEDLFGDGEILVTSHSGTEQVANLVDRCKIRWPKAAGKITYSDTPPGGSWERVLVNNFWQDFHIYMRPDPAAVADVFHPANRPQAEALLPERLRRLSSRPLVSCDGHLSIAPLRGDRNHLQGVAANDLAAAWIGGSPRQNYLWCSRLPSSLTPGFEHPTNRVLATEAALAWMTIYRNLAEQLTLASPKGRIGLSCGCDFSEFGPLATDRILYSLSYDSKCLTRTRISALEARRPSKWINALLRMMTDAYIEREGLFVQRALLDNQPSVPETANSAQLDVDPRPDPFSGGGDVTTQICPPHLKAMVMSHTIVDTTTLENLFGLDQISDVRVMTDTEKAAYYRMIIKIDPEAVNYFPNPEQGVLDDEETLTGNTSYLGQTMVFRTFVKVLESDTFAHVTSLFPGSPVFPELGSVSNPRFVLFEEPITDEKGPETQPSSIGNLRYAATLDLSGLFAFVPNMPPNVSLDLVTDLSQQTTFEPFQPGGSLTLWGQLDQDITISSQCTLSNVHLGVCLVNQHDMQTDHSERVLTPVFSATLSLDFGSGKPTTFQANGGKNDDDRAYLSASVKDWYQPFGIDALTLDEVALDLTLDPLEAEVHAKIDIDGIDEIDLVGSWSPDDGVALLAELEEPLDLSKLVALHQHITQSASPLDPGDDAEGISLEDVHVSFCTKATTLDDIDCPAGFALHGKLSIPDRSDTFDEATVEVTVEISLDEGIKFSGEATGLSFGPVEVDDIELSFQICPKYPQRNYLQVAGTFDLLSKFEIDALVRLGKKRCVFARTGEIDFHISDLISGFSWLDFEFSDLAFSYANEEMTVELPIAKGSQALEEIDLAQGKTLAGDVQFALLDKLFGKGMPIGFGYHFDSSELDFVFSGEPDAGLAGRLSSPTGLDLRIRDETLLCSYDTSFTLFGDHVDLQSGFTFGPPSGDDALSVTFYAEYDGNLHFRFPGATNALVIRELVLDADVSPGGSMGDLSAGGSFDFGGAHAEIDFTLSEDPADEAFRAEIDHTNLSDILTFGLQVVGLPHFEIPLLDEIIVNKLVLYFSSQKMVLGTKSYPAGFSFDADLVVFGETVDAQLSLSGDQFKAELELSPFSLGPVSVKGADGKNPYFLLEGPDPAQITIDCAVHFLAVDISTKINIKPPKIFDFDLEYDFLGSELAIHAHKEGDGDFDLSFYLGDDQREQARQQVIQRVETAVQNLQQSAAETDVDAQRAENEYNAAMEVLNQGLTDAMNAFNDYCAKMKKTFDDEQDDLDKMRDDAENDINTVIADLKGNKKSTGDDFRKMKADLSADCDAATKDLTKLEKQLASTGIDFKHSLDQTKKNFDDKIDKAKGDVEDALSRSKKAQKDLDVIKNAKPHGRHCSHSEKESWQRHMDKAQSELDAAQGDWLRATFQVALQKAKKDKAVDNLIKEADSGLQDLMDRVTDQAKTVGGLQAALASIAGSPNLEEISDLDSQLAMMGDKYSHKVSALQHLEQAETAGDRLEVKKADLDIEQAEKHIQALQNEGSPDPEALSAAEKALAAATDARDQAQIRIDQADAALQQQIDQLQATYDVDKAQLEQQIQQLEAGLPTIGSLQRLEAEFLRADKTLTKANAAGKQHLDDLDKKLQTAADHAAELQSDKAKADSPAGQRLAAANKNLADCKDGKLYKTLVAAQHHQQASANDAAIAAEIFKRVEESSNFSIGHISAEALWTHDDLIFDFEVVLDLHIHFEFLGIHINIDLGPITLAHLHFDLQEFEKLVDHLFSVVWDEISKAW